MSYTTGNYTNYLNRLHELPTKLGDLTTGFIPEGSGYCFTGGILNLKSPTISLQMVGDWEREARLKKYQITNSGVVLQQTIFTSQW